MSRLHTGIINHGLDTTPAMTEPPDDEPTRIQVEMNQWTVRDALALVGKQEIEWADTDESGLGIRIRAKSATWILRGRVRGGKQSTWTIGPVSAATLTKVRIWVAEAKTKMRGGQDPAAFLRSKATGVPEAVAVEPAAVEPEPPPVPDPPPPDPGLLWEDGRDMFLKAKAQTLSPWTINGYRKTLTSPDMKPLQGRPLKSITSWDIRGIQEEIFYRGHPPAAHLALRTLKSCFSWLANHSKSGIEFSPAAAVKKLDEGKLAKSGAGFKLGWVPTPDEIGDLVWKMAKHTGAPSSRLAACMVLFTLQRIETVLSARKIETTAALDGGLWDIPPAHMKSKRQHLLPLTSTAWHVANQAFALAPTDNPLLFPQTRERRKDSGMDGHLSLGAVADAMGGMGRHALRRAFGTHGMAVLGFKLEEVKGILDHAEGSGGDVTLERYALSDGQYYKWRVLRAWESWVLEQVARRAPPGSGTVPAFLRHVRVANTGLEGKLDQLVAIEYSPSPIADYSAYLDA